MAPLSILASDDPPVDVRGEYRFGGSDRRFGFDHAIFVLVCLSFGAATGL